MGCGCGSSNKKETLNTRLQGTVGRIKQVIKKSWDSTRHDQPIHVVKQINKKIK